MGLSKIAVVIKGFSTGFNQPIAGIRYRTLVRSMDRLLEFDNDKCFYYI